MVPANWDGTAWTPGSQVMPGGGGAINRHLWCATARTTVNAIPSFSLSQRGKKDIFVRGLKEVVHIETTTNAPWQWRRIVFSVKALGRHASADDYVAFNQPNGYMRAVRPITSPSSFRDDLEKMVFQGTSQVDWLTSMVAPVNTSNVSLHSDVTREINSGNAMGRLHTFKIWTPINKTLHYNDREDGQTSIPSRYSVDDRTGMGDLWVLDYFRSSLGSIAADVCDWRPNATLYWHEK